MSESSENEERDAATVSELNAWIDSGTLGEEGVVLLQRAAEAIERCHCVIKSMQET